MLISTQEASEILNVDYIAFSVILRKHKNAIKPVVVNVDGYKRNFFDYEEIIRFSEESVKRKSMPTWMVNNFYNGLNRYRNELTAMTEIRIRDNKNKTIDRIANELEE